MDFITPTTLALGQGVLSLGQGLLGNQASQQDYVNQRALQKASGLNPCSLNRHR